MPGQEGGVLFSDGSAKPADQPRLRHSGYGVVRWGAEGFETVFCRPVTGGWHSAARAELQAAVDSVATWRDPHLMIDASYVVNGGLDVAKLARITRPNGDLWILLRQAQRAGRTWLFSKVKGHVDPNSCEDEAAARIAAGNEAADAVAKAATVVRVLPSWGVSDNSLRRLHTFFVACRTLAVDALQNSEPEEAREVEGLRDQCDWTQQLSVPSTVAALLPARHPLAAAGDWRGVGSSGGLIHCGGLPIFVMVETVLVSLSLWFASCSAPAHCHQFSLSRRGGFLHPSITIV